MNLTVFLRMRPRIDIEQSAAFYWNASFRLDAFRQGYA